MHHSLLNISKNNLSSKAISLVSLITILLAFLSCDNELIVSDATLPVIYIDGEVTTEKEYISVTIKRVFPLNELYSQSPYINNANVTLLGNDSIYSFTCIDSLGVYTSNKKIQGKCGLTYTLNINYDDINYIASAIIPPYPDADFYLPFYTYDEESYSPDYLLVDNFGYTLTNEWKITEDSTNGQTNYSEISSTTYKGTPMQGNIAGLSYYKLDSSIDTLEIAKYGLTTTYEEYLFDLMNETEWENNIFSTQRANITTNFSEGAVGFFATKSVIRKRMDVKELNITVGESTY